MWLVCDVRKSHSVIASIGLKKSSTSPIVTRTTSAGERSPRVVSLLQWHHTVFPRPDKAAAIAKFVGYLLEPSNSEAYGMRDGILQTGFVGLVFADLIQPYVTFSPPAER